MIFIIIVNGMVMKKFKKNHIREKFWASLSITAIKTKPTKVRVINLKSFSMKYKTPFLYFFTFVVNKSIKKNIGFEIH